VDRSEQLGQFLRARRARTRPEDVGLPDDRRRRVPGLRREELAMLAGLSADYYTRLEQGRGHRPSEQVLGALARALGLDADATAHLFFLGRAVPSAATRDAGRGEGVPAELRDLLEAWTATPAIIHGRLLDILASNALARALTPLAEPGTNLLRSVFLDPDARNRYADPASTSAAAVAYLRGNVGGDAGDPELTALVDELSLASEEFRRLWAQHDVLSAQMGDSDFVHPVVGVMRLRYQTFAVEGADRLTLLVVHTAPGSQDAAALERLAEQVTPAARLHAR
jgi:transcriptional regulator with XRE-family HTH domain